MVILPMLCSFYSLTNSNCKVLKSQIRIKLNVCVCLVLNLVLASKAETCS